tara:strand:+ start:1289 stop:2794 length:1506 start_codon:yes stop_codon:yes gene_type:complete
MADEARLSPFVFACQGGLVLDQSTFAMQPGMALELSNFEPDIRGGYRRISGYSKWNSNIVPQTSSSSEPVLLSAHFKGNVIAARGQKVFKGGTTGSWTEIDTGRTSAEKYTFFRYNLGGTEFIVWADGANHASKYDNTTVTDLNATGAPSDPKFVTGFKDALFFAGMSSNPQALVFTAPFTDDDFNVANGAGTIQVDSDITGLFPFRNQLFIFCQERIFRLTGNTIADFVVQPVTREIGCINGFTIQEFAGDVVFLAPDGLRTVAGTERIGDVELGTISRKVQRRFAGITDVDEFDSVVVPDKTQYRIFFSKSSTVRASTAGVIAVRKGNDYEFADIKGIRPSSTDSVVAAGESIVLHGEFDGFVYRQEQGDTFDGSNIEGKYRSPDLTMGDAGLRKNFQRVIINYAPEATVNADLFVRYDYESPTVARPAAYPFDTSTSVAIYGTSLYNTATYGGQSNPLVRQPIEGSGFAIALRVNDRGTSAPYSLKGFQLEFNAGARR